MVTYKPIKLLDPDGKMTKINNWLIYNIEYNVTTCNTLAINEVLNAYAILQDHADIFRHKVKRGARLAADIAEQYRNVMLQYMNNPERMDDFTDGIVNIISDDMHMLRALVKKELGSNGCKNVEVTAWVEVARIMLIIATNNYDIIIKNANEMLAKQELGKAIHSSAFDFAGKLSMLRLTELLKTWEQVADHLDPNAISIVSEPVENTLHRIGMDFANDVYTDRCMRLMAEKGDEFFIKEVERRNQNNS